jgi:genome maintenance exonuclease 1
MWLWRKFFRLIATKFDYQALTRETVNGQRLYATPTGDRLPSVTTILDRTQPEKKRQALQAWRDRVGHAQAQAITTEAANRGTRMHTYLEHYVRNGAMKERGPNPFSWPSHDMAQTVIEHGLSQVTEYWGIEVPLYFPRVYAGTTDCVGLHQGTPAIMDFKQSNRPKREEWIDDYKLQLAAYAEAHNEIHGTHIQRGVILMCVKPTETQSGVYSTPPQYQQWVIEGAEFQHWTRAWWKRVEQYYILNM